MADTTFTPYTTTITSEWAQDVNNHVYRCGYKTLEDYGGSADGVTDNVGAFNDAIADGIQRILAPASGDYYFSAGITLPDGCSIEGGSMFGGYPATGTRLVFAQNVTTCVTLTSGNNRTSILKDLTVTRTGTPPSGSVGILAYGAYAIQLINVNCVNHAILYQFYSRSIGGITANMMNCWGSQATEHYFDVDNWPELRIVGGRFGANGAGDSLTCESFFLIQGGDPAPGAGAGPNTIMVTNTQFNQGVAGAPYYFCKLDNFVAVGAGNACEFTFSQCHIEGVSQAIFKTTASAALLSRLLFTSNEVNCPSTPFFDLHTDTYMTECIVSNNILFVSDCIVNAVVNQGDWNIFSNNQFLGDVSFTNPASVLAGGTLILDGNLYRGDLTLGGHWGALGLSGSIGCLGTFTDNTTGGVSITDPLLSFKEFTPTLNSVGGNTGITYAKQSGSYQIYGKEVTGQLIIELTNKGALNGSTYIELPGLPEVSAELWSNGNSGNVPYATNLASLTSPISCTIGSGPVLNLYDWGAAGIVTLDHTNITNTTYLSVNFCYFTD